MKCGSDLPLLVNKSYLNDEISLISHVDTTSGEYWRECDILIPQKIHGSTDITSAKEVKGKLIYADLTEVLIFIYFFQLLPRLLVKATLLSGQ